MNFKKTALVLAMAGVVSAPIAVQASAGDGAYASIRIGVQMVEANGGFGAVQTTGSSTVGSDSTTVSGYASRFGFKSESDLGNGLTGFGEYQFSVNTDSTASTVGNRLAYVGVKGDFGKVSVGREYATFYDFAVAGADNPWAGSGYAMVQYRGRQSNGLSWASSTGNVSFGITLQMDGTGKETTGDQETTDATELGISFDAGFATFGLATLDRSADKSTVGVKDPEMVTALLVSGIAAGPVTLGFGYQTQDNDADATMAANTTTTSMLIDATFNNIYVHYETKDLDQAAGLGDMDSLAIGYTMSLGPQTSAWFEYHDVDTDTVDGNSGDSTELRAIMKYDI
jgi:predicted porin